MRMPGSGPPGGAVHADRCSTAAGACDRSGDSGDGERWTERRARFAASVLEAVEAGLGRRGRGECGSVATYGFLGFSGAAFPNLALEGQGQERGRDRRNSVCASCGRGGVVYRRRGGGDVESVLGLVREGFRWSAEAHVVHWSAGGAGDVGVECAPQVANLLALLHCGRGSMFGFDSVASGVSSCGRETVIGVPVPPGGRGASSPSPGGPLVQFVAREWSNWGSRFSAHGVQAEGSGRATSECTCGGSQRKLTSGGEFGAAVGTPVGVSGLGFVRHAAQEFCDWTAHVLQHKKGSAGETEDLPRQEMVVGGPKHRFLNLSSLGFISSGFHPLGKYTGRRFSPPGAFLFARVQGEPDVSPAVPHQEDTGGTHQPAESESAVVPENKSPNPFTYKVLNMDKLRESLSGALLSDLVELVPQIGKPRQPFPDKKKLSSVQDFFQYTRAEGRKLFEELDRDNDGQVTLEDLETAMSKRRLPKRYAKDFLQRTRRRWFAKSFGWSEFSTLMEQKESVMLRAFNSLSLSKSGTLQKHQVLASLRSIGLPATEGNAAAMMRCLDVDTDGSIAYGQFRNFMLLLPPERLEDDPRMVWFEAATVVPLAPPLKIHAGSVLKSALAGGLACALSTCLLHPVDTMKTRVQASTLSFSEVISALPQIGVQGLYRGSIPAIIGQFSSHGLRTGIFEASKMVLRNVAPQVPDLQAQSLASFCSTILGTAVRIPCEVLKQRLQAGLYSNVGEAIAGTFRRDGLRGFFRGTAATLCREVPFYVAGMGIYEESKKGLHGVLQRELAPWETIVVGGLSGGLAAVCTTPFDVMKTRMMTAAPGMPVTMSAIAVAIVQEEGVLALFKGALPRFFWIAPLGAMNFAGYELAKRAMEKREKDPEVAADSKILDIAHS